MTITIEDVAPDARTRRQWVRKHGKVSPPETHWDETRLKQLEVLWNSGLSASQCATEMNIGVSRNAVIGAIHRHNGKVFGDHTICFAIAKSVRAEKNRKQQLARMDREVTRKVNAARQATKQKQREAKAPAAPDRSIEQSAIFTEITETAKPFALLADNECHWPLGDLYCGDSVADARGCRYCKTHLFYSQRRKVA